MAVVSWCLVACSGSETNEPPEIAYGLEECYHCRMIISEEGHAAAVDLGDGEFRKFDDIGCLLGSVRDLESAPRQAWVHAADSGEWLEATRAVFVVDQARMTPMGSGVVASSSEAAARERVGTSETVYDWEGLVAAGLLLHTPDQENSG